MCKLWLGRMEIKLAITPSCQIFKGLSLPVSVKWLQTIEKKLEIARTEEADKVPFATHYLEGAAAIWWDNAKALWPAGEEIMWTNFKDKFLKYHIPAGITKVKQHDFIGLTQGNLSVSEYLRKFNHLARYSLYDVAMEEKKTERFLGGLNQHRVLSVCSTFHIFSLW